MNRVHQLELVMYAWRMECRPRSGWLPIKMTLSNPEVMCAARRCKRISDTSP